MEARGLEIHGNHVLYTTNLIEAEMADGPISTGLMNAFQIYGQQQGLDLTRRQIGLREQELQQDRSRMEAEARRNDFIRTMDFYKTQIDAAGNKKFATKFRQNAGDTAMGLLRDRIYPAMGLDGSKLPDSIDVSMFDQDIVDYKNKLNEVYSQWKDKKLSDSDALMQFSMINSEFPSIESRLSPGDAQKIIQGEKAATETSLEQLLTTRVKEGKMTLEDAFAVKQGKKRIHIDPTTGEVTIEEGAIIEATPTVRTRAQEKLDEIESAIGVMGDIRNVIKPENVGLSGDLRNFVFGTAQQAEAFRISLEGLKGDVAADLSANGFTGNQFKFFDPNLSQLDALENLLAYKLARSLDPSGRLSDFDVQNAKQSIGLGKKLTGIRDVGTRLDAIEQTLIRERNIQNKRLGIITPEQAPSKPKKEFTYDPVTGELK